MPSDFTAFNTGTYGSSDDSPKSGKPDFVCPHSVKLNGGVVVNNAAVVQ